MSESIHQALGAAVLRILRPLVRVLLRHGMAYGSFAELARKAYVEEGFALTEASGRRPTVSGVSAFTGLTRKETKRLREIQPGLEAGGSQRYSRAIRVISGWTGDARFLTSEGEPARLPMDGGESSFSVLVKDYSGDIPPAAMLSVLQDSGTVQSGGGFVELLRKAYVPSDTPLEKVNILGNDVAELIATIDHNLDDAAAELYFQRKVSNVLLHPASLPAFRELSNRRSQELLEEYHAWLSDHEIDDSDEPQQRGCYVAVGIYYYEGEPPHDEELS